MASPIQKEPNTTATTSVYVLSPAGQLPREWESEAKAAGIRTSRVATLGSVKTKLSFNPNPVLVIRYGSDQDLGLQLLKKMLKLPELHGLTLVVIGKEAEELEEELSKIQRIVLSLSEPCSAMSYVEVMRRAVTLNETTAGTTTPRAKVSVEPLTLLELPKSDFAERLFKYLSTSKIRGQIIGGHRYVSVANSTPLLDELLQANGWAKDLLTPVLESKDTWLRSHVARAAYMTDKILGALDLNDEQRRLGQFGAILRTEAFKDKPRLLRIDYTRDNAGTLRHEVADTLSESSRTIAKRTGDRHLSALVELTAKLIEGTGSVNELDDDMIMASSIVATDSVERACWSLGFFNSLRAYLLLKKWRNGDLPPLHFGVVCCTAKFVSEGVIAVPFRHMLAKGARIVPPKIFDSIDGKPPPADWGRMVEIHSLSPGMKLISPLVTFDGKEVLQTDVKLDDDLIWRIWQLASVRPIRMACVAP